MSHVPLSSAQAATGLRGSRDMGIAVAGGYEGHFIYAVWKRAGHSIRQVALFSAQAANRLRGCSDMPIAVGDGHVSNVRGSI